MLIKQIQSFYCTHVSQSSPETPFTAEGEGGGRRDWWGAFRRGLSCECSMMRDKGAPATGRARLLVVRRLSTPQGISPSSLNSSYGDLCIPTTAMVQLKDDTPTLKEALKQDRAQYDDCTPCRIVGMMFRRFCLSTTFAQTLYMFGESLFIILLIHLDRKCHLRGARRLHLRVRPLPDQSERSDSTG